MGVTKQNRKRERLSKKEIERETVNRSMYLERETVSGKRYR